MRALCRSTEDGNFIGEKNAILCVKRKELDKQALRIACLFCKSAFTQTKS